MPDNEPAPADAEPAGGPGIGERLRAARERRGLSIDQLADYLRLDESVVVALEGDDFDALGAPVFVRGHLKTCARFLDLDVDELLGDYAAAAPEPVVRSVTPGQGSGASITISLAPWGAGALGVLLAIGLAAYLIQDGADPAPESAAPAAAPPSAAVEVSPAPAPSSAEPPAATAAAPEPAVRSEPPAMPPQPEPEAEPEVAPLEGSEATAAVADLEPEPEPEASASAGQTLTLYFRGESWTEISDRNGRLLFGLQREGIRRELTGEAPFRLLLGNAPAVDLYLDGEPYDLPAGSTRGKVARFVIEPGPGQGSR